MFCENNGEGKLQHLMEVFENKCKTFLLISNLTKCILSNVRGIFLKVL